MSYTIKGLAHIGIMSNDNKASAKFYEELLDFKVFYEKTLENGTELTFVKNGNIVLEFINNDADANSMTSGQIAHVAIEVTAIDEIVKKLRAAGVDSFKTDEPINKPELFPTGSRMMFFTGPSGEIIELYEYKSI